MEAARNAAISRRGFLELLALAGAAGMSVGIVGCGDGRSGSQSSALDLNLDSSNWGYDADADVYYQVGVPYCQHPAVPSYESMGIYVPGPYFVGTENGDGTFTCEVSGDGQVNGYTAATAPIVMPINTAGYAAQEAPTAFDARGLADYLQAGYVYVYAGCRGRKMSEEGSGAAPWGVTDLKAAVRTLRYNAAKIPGDKDRIFSLGMSGGGAQSAVLGASGDAPGYDDYLASIGAPAVDAEGNALSDAIFGSMCWCPITNLDQADAAYEWNMGQFSSGGTRAEGTFTRLLSRNLATGYADYINGLGLVDATGEKLLLAEGGEGIGTSGTYYDHVKAVVEGSLNNFLADTEFPYTPTNAFDADMGAGGGPGRPGGGRPGGELPEGGRPDGMRPGGGGLDGEAPEDAAPGDGFPEGGASDGMRDPGVRPDDGEAPGDEGDASLEADAQVATSYETPADYIASLNGEDPWIEYDEERGTATITGLAGFVAACKQPTKDVGAFDALDRSQAENEVFGDDGGNGLHFDAAIANLLMVNKNAYAALSGWDDAYPSDFAGDRELEDSLGNDSDFRQNLYNPLYYLCPAYDGAGESQPAVHWRIRTGIQQGDTASTTEINLALALDANDAVEDVDFETVWGQGHTMAERTGSSTGNFIAWVDGLCKA